MESANISPMDKSVKNIRVAHSATAVGDAIYVFGGWDGSKYLNHGFLYDPLKLTITSELSKGRNVFLYIQLQILNSCIASPWTTRSYINTCTGAISALWRMELFGNV